MQLETHLAVEADWVPEGLEAFRRRRIHHPGKAVGLHTTLASGICRPDQITEDVMCQLSNLSASVGAFDYQAVCVNAFPKGNVLWLAPMPVSYFEHLVGRIYDEFPQTRGGWPFPTFHMTIGLLPGREEMYEALQEFFDDFGGLLPLKFRAKELALWVREGDEFWRHSSYPFAPAT